MASCHGAQRSGCVIGAIFDLWLTLVRSDRCEENIQELCSEEKGVTSPKKGVGFEKIQMWAET